MVLLLGGCAGLRCADERQKHELFPEQAMKFFFPFAFFLLGFASLHAQENSPYQKPPKEIIELVDVERAPFVRIDSKGENMLLFYYNPYTTVAELSEKEMRLAGLRINPVTNISSRMTYVHTVKIQKTNSTVAKQVTGLPTNARLAHFTWAPDQKKMAFTHTTATGVELWIVDIASATATKCGSVVLNANMGNPLRWFADGEALLVRVLPKARKPLIDTENAVPSGPIISVSAGSKAQNRTYQDLLKDKNDEHNFEQLALSELHRVQLNGKATRWAAAAMYEDVSFSPDGKYVLVSVVRKPFSYLVPYHRFPQDMVLYNRFGKVVTTVASVPLTEELPKGFMAVRTGKRNIDWRDDHPATLVWAEALDNGDPAKEVEFRDEVLQLRAPFTEAPLSLLKTKNRYSGISWATDTIAIARDYWWNTRNAKTYVFNPSQPSQEPRIIVDRNYQDRYSDPGSFVYHKNEYGKDVLALEDNNAYLIGDGYTKEGQFPFIDKLDLATQKTTRVYQSAYTDKVESINSAIDVQKGMFLVRIESPDEYPNYYMRTIKDKEELRQITHFANPFTSIQNVHKQVMKYKREDGLDLSGTLYLPVGYDTAKKEKMPMILWAYPTEYKDKNSASQSTANPNEFTYPYYGSMVYWVTRGYVVLDNASFPIVGEGSTEPNDTFIPQLVANAKAAIDAVDALGYIDRNRVAVGGHSYGAFMTANLLSHSNLFAAGIARSGAYNRTLTPFGFQSEERTYWDAPDVYNEMSPFASANTMKTPLLLIHGEADNNSGTYTMQSERYFHALKGLGATARLVVLPKESHGYRAKESVLHLLWEQDQWLEQYVKNRSREEAQNKEEERR